MIFCALQHAVKTVFSVTRRGSVVSAVVTPILREVTALVTVGKDLSSMKIYGNAVVSIDITILDIY